MRKKVPRKFIFALILTSVVLSSLVLPLTPNIAYADQQVDNSQNGRRWLDNATNTLGERCSITSIIIGLKLNCIILDIVWLVDKFLDLTVLNIATYIFDLSINYSTTDVSGSPFVTIGWGIVRDIANLFFIFILLWIAIATIFDIPGYGAKSILAQLIIAALLVNFSLAIGGFFVNFTNALGKAFLNPLRSGNCIVGTDISCGISDQLLAFTHIQDVSTQDLSPIDQKAICDKQISIFRPGFNYGRCMSDPNAAKIYDDPDSAITRAIYQALWLIIVIPILAFIFFAGAIFFLVRYLMLSILLIFAPIVFLFFVLPSTRSHWSDWWNKLIQWSFFAPVFLFLLFLTIKLFSQLTLANVQAGAATQKGFFGIAFDMILLITLMVMNLMVAQKMGIMLSGTVIGWGRGISGWTGKQARGLAYRGAVRAAAPVAAGIAETGFGRALARTPGFRALTQPMVAIQAEREKIDADRAKQIERAAAVSPDLAIARLKGESMGVQAAFAKSASPENMRKLMTKMSPSDQEEYVSRLHASKDKYGIIDLDKKVGEALAKEKNGLDMRVVAKEGVRTTDSTFQNEVNGYLDALTDQELNQALSAKTIAENPRALEYILKSFRDEMRIGRAVFGTPEKLKAFNDLVTASGGRSGMAAEMRSRGNTRGATDLQGNLILGVLQGGGPRPFTSQQRRPPQPPPPSGGTPPPAAPPSTPSGGTPPSSGGPAAPPRQPFTPSAGGGGLAASPRATPPAPPGPAAPAATPPSGGPAAPAPSMATPPSSEQVQQQARLRREVAERRIGELEKQLRDETATGKDTEKANQIRNEINKLRTAPGGTEEKRGEEGRQPPRREAPPIVSAPPSGVIATPGGTSRTAPPTTRSSGGGLDVAGAQRTEIERQQRKRETGERVALRRELRQTRQEVGQVRKEMKGREGAEKEAPPSTETPQRTPPPTATTPPPSAPTPEPPAS